MGGCNSASAGHLVRSVEQRCAGRRAGSSTSSSSSASSSPLPAHGAQCRETSSKENAAIKQAGGTNWRPERPEREQSGAGGAVRKKVEEEGCRLVGAREAASLAQRKREENTAAPMEEPWRGKDREQEEERRKRFEKLREGVDFIETEEDAEAVESAVVKIQSTFRGKKIRSKLNQKPQAEVEAAQPAAKSATRSSSEAAVELSKKVATMDVNDKAVGKEQAGSTASGSNLPEDEAQRAATKIQAGFKGYKTRKELEGIMASGAVQQQQQQQQGEEEKS